MKIAVMNGGFQRRQPAQERLGLLGRRHARPPCSIRTPKGPTVMRPLGTHMMMRPQGGCHDAGPTIRTRPALQWSELPDRLERNRLGEIVSPSAGVIAK